MLLPNISPVGTERTEYDRNHKKYLYFCKNCVHNVHSEQPMKKCNLCGSNNIISLEKGKRKTKNQIIKERFYHKTLDFVGKENKGARITEKIHKLLKRKLTN